MLDSNSALFDICAAAAMGAAVVFQVVVHYCDIVATG